MSLSHQQPVRRTDLTENCLAAAVEDIERALVARSTLTRVRDVMATLPEEQQTAIMLVCVNGLSYQEAAAELDIPIGTLMSRLCRGRLELARRINLSKQSNAA